MQKCSGYSCLHRDRCLRYTKCKEKTRGSWVNADSCINADEPYEKLIIEDKMELTLEEQTQVDRLVANAKAMKPHDLEKFIDNVQSGDGSTILKEAVLSGIEGFKTARANAEAVSADFTDEESPNAE